MSATTPTTATGTATAATGKLLPPVVPSLPVPPPPGGGLLAQLGEFEGVGVSVQK